MSFKIKMKSILKAPILNIKKVQFKKISKREGNLTKLQNLKSLKIAEKVKIFNRKRKMI